MKTEMFLYSLLFKGHLCLSLCIFYFLYRLLDMWDHTLEQEALLWWRYKPNQAKQTHGNVLLVQIKSVLFTLHQNRNHIASVGFTICTVDDILCP